MFPLVLILYVFFLKTWDHTSRREGAGSCLGASSDSGRSHDIVWRTVNPWTSLGRAGHTHPISTTSRYTSTCMELTHLLMLVLLLMHAMMTHLIHGPHLVHRMHVINLIHLIHLTHVVHLMH